MEIKLNVKQPGRADINFEFSCNAEEAAVLINDPVYQDLGRALVDHVRLENEALRRNKDHQQQKYSDNFRRQFDVMKKNIEILEKRIASFQKNSGL